MWAEAARSYASHFGEAYAADITRLSAEDFVSLTRGRTVAAVVAGPPCQPFSRASSGALGEEDPRGEIALHVVRAVRALRPRVVVMEQAPTLMARFAPFLRRVGTELEAAGYDTQATLVDMSRYGVPQKRRRTFVVGVRRSPGLPHPPRSHFSPPSADVTTLRGFAWGREADGERVSEAHWARIAAYERQSRCARPRDLRPDEPSRTVTASNIMSTTNDCLRVLVPAGEGGGEAWRRKISFEEAEALMTLPRGWTSRATSKRDRARLIGNAVPPAVLGNLLAPHVVAVVEGGEEEARSAASAATAEATDHRAPGSG